MKVTIDLDKVDIPVMSVIKFVVDNGYCLKMSDGDFTLEPLESVQYQNMKHHVE